MRAPRPRIPLCAAALLAGLAPAAAAIPFDAPAGLVVLEALLDGRVVRLLLDTGDPGGLSLDEAAVRRLGLPVGAAPAPVPPARGLLGPAPGGTGTARVGRLAADGAVWTGLEAAVIREDAALARAIGAPYDGVLGAGLLADIRLVIDHPGGAIALSRPPGRGPGAAGGPPSSPLRIEGGRFVTEVDLGRGRRPSIIDTASAATFIDPAAAGRWRSDPAGPVGIVDSGGHSAGLPAARLDRLAAGGALLRDIPVLLLDLAEQGRAAAPSGPAPPAAILGADLLSRHRVVLDPAGGRFALEEARR